MKTGFFKSTVGNAAIEFAFVVPVLLLLLSGVVNFGMIIAKKNELTTVASRGMLYAFGNSSSPGQVQNAMTGATNITPLNVSVTQYCECINGTQPSCGSTCSDGFTASKYIKVTASSTVDLIALDLVLTNPYPITVEGTMRVP